MAVERVDTVVFVEMMVLVEHNQRRHDRHDGSEPTIAMSIRVDDGGEIRRVPWRRLAQFAPIHHAMAQGNDVC